MGQYFVPFEKYWESAHRRIFLELIVFDDLSIDDFMAQYIIFDHEIWEEIHDGKISVAFGREERVRLVLDYFKIPYKELFIKNFFDIYLTALIEEIKTDELLVERIKKLSKHYSIAILSNGDSWEQREKIRQFGFENLFPVYISEEMGIQKPYLAAFTILLEAARFEAEETMMVGDTVINDIRPANRLGMTTVFIEEAYHTEADYEFESLDAFLDALEARI